MLEALLDSIQICQPGCPCSLLVQTKVAPAALQALGYVQVDVDLQPGHLWVAMDGVPLLNGPLLHEVKQDESTWYIQDGILHITLLKRSRRGNYADGTSNAHTFWCSILKQQPPAECIALQRPPLAYYNSYWEPDRANDAVKAVRRNRPMIRPAGS